MPDTREEITFEVACYRHTNTNIHYQSNFTNLQQAEEYKKFWESIIRGYTAKIFKVTKQITSVELEEK